MDLFINNVNLSQARAELTRNPRRLDEVKTISMRVSAQTTGVFKMRVLSFACANGLTNYVRMLIEVGANLQQTDMNWNPLHWACRFGHCSVAELLLDAGLDPNTREFPDGRSALHLACNQDDVSVVRLLVARGSELNSTFHIGTTALMLAIKQRKFEVCSVLIDCGIDADVKDRLGQTAFELLDHQDDDLVEELRIQYDNVFLMK